MFSSPSIHSKPINKCGMSFTVAAKRLIFIKKGRNGHLLGSRGTWLCFDSDDKRTWQLNYVLNTRFLFYFGDGNPLCEFPLRLNTRRAAPAVAPVLFLVSCGSQVCHMVLCYLPTSIRNIYNEWKAHAHSALRGASCIYAAICLLMWPPWLTQARTQQILF